MPYNEYILVNSLLLIMERNTFRETFAVPVAVPLTLGPFLIVRLEVVLHKVVVLVSGSAGAGRSVGVPRLCCLRVLAVVGIV